jgi:type IV pilus assembly protein PilX
MIAKNTMNTSPKAKFLSYLPKKYEPYQPRGQRGQRGQRGITLIMVLVFIVTLSLIAAVGMRGVITGDRVVANERDRALSFQAAESAIREAVDLIAASPRDLTKYSVLGGSDPTSPLGLPLGGNIEHWRTTSGKTAATTCVIPNADASTTRFKWDDTCSTQSGNKYSNTQQPRYVIELASKVPVGAVTPPTKYECWYRITSRATGGTNEADVILQAMFSLEITSGKCDKETP